MQVVRTLILLTQVHCLWCILMDLPQQLMDLEAALIKDPVDCHSTTVLLK